MEGLVNESGFSSPKPMSLRRGSSTLFAAAFLTLGLMAPSPARAVTPVSTTREDFKLPGTQPLSLTDNLAVPSDCTSCHSNYGAPEVEPYRNWQGSMMAQSGRDPLTYAAMDIANPDAPHAREMRIRCHTCKGW